MADKGGWACRRGRRAFVGITVPASGAGGAVSPYRGTGARMRRWRLWLPLVIALLALALTAGSGQAQQMGPKDFSFTQSKALGPVLFSHQKHVKKGLQCTDCHVKIFQMKKGQTTGGKPMLMSDMNEGKQCGACHNGKKSFATFECFKCHAQKK